MAQGMTSGQKLGAHQEELRQIRHQAANPPRANQSINHKSIMVARRLMLTHHPMKKEKRPLVRTRTRRWLFGAVLDLVAGLFHVLAEAVGRIAAEPGDGQQSGDE